VTQVTDPPRTAAYDAGVINLHKETVMEQNVGGIDKLVRIVLGLALLAAMLVVDGSARWLGLIGLVPLVTGLFGFCPLYSLFGISSCPLKASRQAR
jgi:hypothetical protein